MSKTELQLLRKEILEDDGDDDEPIHFLLTQMKSVLANKNRISDTWILLDNQSTCHIFRNRKLLRNIRKCKPGDEIKIHSNGNGYLIADLIGDLPGVGAVHYHPESIANVLSFSKIAKKYPICFNGRKDNAFLVYGDNNVVRFAHSKHGLYYHDTAANKENVQLVQTVKSNEAQFTKRQVDQARLARQLYSLLGRPSHEAFVNFVRNNSLKNCPIDVTDANRSIQIYGPDIPALRGKSVREQPGHVTTPEISPVPPDILLNHSKIHLCIDVYFVNNIAFLVTISRHIKLRTVDHLPDTQQPTILKSLQQVFRIYTSRGFNIEHIHADGAFRGVEHDLLPARLNITAAGEHVPEIERSIRTLKERTRACIHGLPYKRHPTQMLIANMRFHNTWLNRFPAKDGVSSTLSPRSIVWGDSPDFNIDCRLDFGSYCEVYEPRQTTNSTAARTVGAIALYPSGNNQGGYRFLTLNSARVVTRNQWTCLPVPSTAIELIETLALKENQPDISKHGYVFSWKKLRNLPNADLSSDTVIADEGANVDGQIPNNSDDDDDSYAPSTDSDDDETLAADTETDSDDDSTASDSENKDDDNDDSPNEPDSYDEQQDHQGATNTDEANQGANDTNTTAENNKNQGARDNNDNNNASQGAKKSTRALAALRATTHYDLRQKNKKAKSFRRRFDRIHFQFLQMQRDLDMSEFTGEKIAHYIQTQIMLTQMSAKKGIMMYGDAAIKAIVKEFSQLDELDVFEPMRSKQLTKEQMAKALRSITVIKAKRCGRIKGRNVADGRPQRNYIPKEDSSSPTVGTESLFLSLVIDAFEGRHIVTADIAGAFLHAEMDDFVLVKLDGPMVSYLVRANPNKYKDFVEYERNRRVIYLRLKRALYGCVKSSLLWWKLLTKTLTEKMGFTLNPYDTCVANKTVEDSQLTVLWHVDDLKVSHINKKVVDDTIA